MEMELELTSPHKVRRKPPPVIHRASADNVHGSTCEGGFVSLDGVDAGWDEDRRGDVARVSAALPALRADEVDACFERFGDVLGVADHLSRMCRHM